MPDRHDRERFRRAGVIGWQLAIWSLSLGVRLLCAWQYCAHPLGRQAWVDESAYLGHAQAIVAGAWLPERPFYQDPLLPYLLAIPVACLGPQVARLRLLAAAVGSLTPLAVYWAGKRGLGRAEGIVAGLATALCAPLVFADILLEKEGPGALLAAVALWFTALAADRGYSPRRVIAAAFAAGLAWGLVALLRANALLLAPLGAAWLVWGHGARGQGDRVGVSPLVVSLGYLLGFAVPLAPVVAINAAVGRPRELIVTTWQAGPNFYIGNGPGANGTYHAPEFVVANPAFEAANFAAEAARRAGRSLPPGRVSRFWLAAGLRQWRDHPGTSLTLLVRKLGLVAHDEEIPDSQDLAVVRAVAVPGLRAGVVSFGVLFVFAALGLARAKAARMPFWWFLILSTAVGLGSTALFFVVGRYRVPWQPGLALLASAGAVDVFRRLAARRWAECALRLLLLAVPAAALAWRPLAEVAPDRWGHAEIALGLAYLAEDRLEPAIDAFDDARALGAGPAGRVAELLAGGPVHDKVARLVGLEQEADRRLGRITLPLVRARWLRQLPDGRAESRRLLEVTARQPSTAAPALREWAAWLLAEPPGGSSREEARALLRRAGEGAQRDPSALILLSLVANDAAPLEKIAVREAGTPAPLRDRVRLARLILAQRARARALVAH